MRKRETDRRRSVSEREIMDNINFTVVYDNGTVDNINISPDYLMMMDPYVFTEDNIKHIAAIVRETR